MYTLGHPKVHKARRSQAMHTYYVIRKGKTNLGILRLTSVIHHLPSVGLKQLCELAHFRCTWEDGTS